MRRLLTRRPTASLAGVAEQVDARDLKSLVRKDMPVRVRPPAPMKSMTYGIYRSPCDNRETLTNTDPGTFHIRLP